MRVGGRASVLGGRAAAVLVCVNGCLSLHAEHVLVLLLAAGVAMAVVVQGVLGMSWCPQDPTLLLSSGKDNRTICWDVTTGAGVGGGGRCRGLTLGA